MVYIIYEEIGSRIREARKTRGMTQEVLAERVDVGVSHIGNIENSKVKPSLDVLIRMMNELRIPAAELFYGYVEEDKHVVSQSVEALLADCTSAERRSLLRILACVKQEMRGEG